MLIKKNFQGEIPANKIMGVETASDTDTYSCNYINEINKKATNSVETSYLGNNPDIDTLRWKNGTYGIYNCSKTPSTGIGVLEVLVYSGDWVVQRFTDVGNGKMWQRTFVSGTTWNGWVQKW